MKTQEAINQFIQHCQAKGLSVHSIRGYQSYLRHFEKEYPELTTDTRAINEFLRRRGETPAKRGAVFKRIQAFYSYLERAHGIPSPVPPRGKVGRPRKFIQRVPKPSPYASPELPIAEGASATVENQFRGGGQVYKIDLHIYIHQGSDANLPELSESQLKAPLQVHLSKV